MEIESRADIAAARARVWQVYAAVEAWPEWTASVRSVERLDDGSLRVGSRVRIRQPKLPVAVWTVTAIDEGRSFVWEATAPGIHTVATHLVKPGDGGTRATARLEQRGPLGGLVGRLAGGLTRRYLAMETAGLKARSEGWGGP